MRQRIYRYQFAGDVSMEDVEASIVIALLAAESLHGECDLQLAAPHYFDAKPRACVVDATTSVGQDFNRILLGFLRREFGTASFQVQAVEAADSVGA
jgi:hypothetical protein